jgi:DNA helicase HerA-like ATPase
MLIVIDEAHSVCPQQPTHELMALATEGAIRIAREGRKFGLYLLLATQRPDKLHINVLSECDNLVLMRMNSAAEHVLTTELDEVELVRCDLSIEKEQRLRAALGSESEDWLG